MNGESIVSRAFEVFRTDAAAPPPLTLRGANAVDSYDLPMPFDAAEDEPTDAYLEGFAFWGVGYLDARSWRHYSPAEPQTLAMVFALAGDELVTLSVRSWPRDDLGREVERILDSFEIIGA